MAYEALTQAIIGAESGGRANARNPRSSAEGAGQFIDSTWLAMIEKHRPDIARGKSREQILQLKFDPALSAEMTQRYAEDNAEYLAARGIEPTEGALSLAHFAGPSGAAALYADPGKSAIATLGEAAARANPFLKGKTGADVIAWADRRIANRPSQAAQATAQNAVARVQPAAMGGGDSVQNMAGGEGMDRLAAAVTGSGYDADRLARAERLGQAGRDIAAKYHNPVGAIGGTVLSGIGAYMRGDEMEKQKADEAQLIKSLSEGVNVPPVVSALLKSSSPEYRQAGMEALLKLQGPKAAPQIQTVEDQFGRKSQYVWNSTSGRYEPFSMGGGQSAPVAPQEVSQPAVRPQAPSASAQAAQPSGPRPAPAASPFPMERPAPTGDAELDQLGAAIFDRLSAQPRQSAPAVSPPSASPAPAAAQPPADLVVGGPVPKAPDGFVHKQAPDGRGFLYQADGTPVLEPKSQADERGKTAAGMEQMPRVAEQFRGGIEQLSRFPEEFGTQAFERAIGPWQADADSEGVGTVGGIVNYFGQLFARADAEMDALKKGGASPTEVRDRIGTATKNLAAVMKPLIRKPGEGAWTDKDQANLEKQIGELSRSRSVGEYERRLGDIRENVSKIFTIDVPEPKSQPRSPNAPATAEETTTWFERGAQSYVPWDWLF